MIALNLKGKISQSFQGKHIGCSKLKAADQVKGALDKYYIYLKKYTSGLSQILERPSIGKYWNISGVPVLHKNVIYTFFRIC